MIEISIQWFVLWLCLSGMVGFFGCLFLVAILRSSKEEPAHFTSAWVDENNAWWANNQRNKTVIPNTRTYTDAPDDTDEDIHLIERLRSNYDEFDYE